MARTPSAPARGSTSHPYDETFIVIEGRARFFVGETTLEAAAGDVVLGPAGVPHRFENLGPGRLQDDRHPPLAGMDPDRSGRELIPLPMGEGLSLRERSDRQGERVRVDHRPSAQAVSPSGRRLTPTETADPHPAGLRPATFSHREKGYRGDYKIVAASSNVNRGDRGNRFSSVP
ncbi:MAG: cupin domain-containing protein [Brevundimonas sp.]|nr:cupin domain-containing protein [Brevundimonas sp.]